MNHISRHPLDRLGYDFIPAPYLPKGKDEYYLRDRQFPQGRNYRLLTNAEIKILEKQGNASDNWAHLRVADGFNPKLVKHCSFYGLVRIGRLEPCYAEFNNLRLPVGLYHSTIISCDIGHNVVIDNVNFMSHYITGDEVILVNINELAATDHAKFGNGILKEGEKEAVRIWLEICNENAGRSVMPFSGMLAADAWLWSKYRDDEVLMEKFRDFTNQRFDRRRGYYGMIGDRTVIKNSRIIKDAWIGSDAYIKGANKIKNLTIHSGPTAKSQIGEGCELVNGIIGNGCRVFYGVKAVRFMLGSNSQLKYGARLINSYLGDNSTISCCEVLNSLIFPAHEQHHNNSFLCAATVLGQSNMAAGATIGSNHNSRGADGELVAGRGFWPGLCVSLKHNSRFASFTLLAKADFPAELDIPLPFSLVNNDVHRDRLTVMPAYWFMYNMYALARNAGKYKARDKRTDKSQYIEYDYLAPDSINEIINGLALIKTAVARAWAKKTKTPVAEKDLLKKGEDLLENEPGVVNSLAVTVEGWENSSRKTELLKVQQAYSIYKELVTYYGTTQLAGWISRKKCKTWQQVQSLLRGLKARTNWKNIGGQLLRETDLQALLRNIRSGKTGNWDEVHAYYHRLSEKYPQQKQEHAVASLLEILQLNPARFTKKTFAALLQQALATREWISRSITESRAKDYQNPFRRMVYDTGAEMEKVTGSLQENSFIREQEQEDQRFREGIAQLLQQFG